MKLWEFRDQLKYKNKQNKQKHYSFNFCPVAKYLLSHFLPKINQAIFFLSQSKTDYLIGIH